MELSLQCFTRTLAIVCGIIIIIVAINMFSLVRVQHLSEIFMPVHYLWMGSVLILAEFENKYVLEQFRLVASYCGRGFYCLFISTLMITTRNR